MNRPGGKRTYYSLTICIVLFVGLFLMVISQYQQINILRDDINNLARDSFGSGLDSDRYMSMQAMKLCSASQEPVLRELEDISRSVCLIQGEYLFVNQDGDYVSWNDINGVVVTSSMVSDITDDGRYVDIQYTGSGFLVDSRGYVVTNKHVALPWGQAGRDRLIIDAGFKPKMIMFRAFFPGIERPFDLEFVSSSEEDDIALLKIIDSSCDVPVLDCAFDTDYYIGMPVTILGYPTGFDLLTARISQEEYRSVNTCFEGLGTELATRMLIKPMATSGICGQVNFGKIAYDAPTAIGASGAPVLDENGRVIAVNAALLKGFAGTNFGVPVSRVKALLETLDN